MFPRIGVHQTAYFTPILSSLPIINLPWINSGNKKCQSYACKRSGESPLSIQYVQIRMFFSVFSCNDFLGTGIQNVLFSFWMIHITNSHNCHLSLLFHFVELFRYIRGFRKLIVNCLIRLLDWIRLQRFFLAFLLSYLASYKLGVLQHGLLYFLLLLYGTQISPNQASSVSWFSVYF